MLVRPSRRMQGILAGVGVAAIAGTAFSSTASPAAAATPATTTPIKHVVVIFQENVSFDHYFATYPTAANTDGTKYRHMGPVPNVNTLKSAGLLTNNPNSVQPMRLGGTAQQITCDQDHDYRPEQMAYNSGLMDKFVQNTSTDTCAAPTYGTTGLGMAYYDGNSVTAEWNYANRFAMSDNSFSDVFGPSAPGAISLISGNTHGFQSYTTANGVPQAAPTTGNDVVSPDVNGVGTIVNDPQPAFDDCSTRNVAGTADPTQKNVGDLLNAKGLTWGWFQGGFAPNTAYAGPGTKATCTSNHNVGDALGGTGEPVSGQPATSTQWGTKGDYIAHHEPFQYYASTANPHHLPPTSVAMIGHTDQANHQYDLTAFDQALAAGSLPAVSYLKAAGYQDGHAAYSDPIDEQHFLVHEINAIESSPYWKNTAIVLAYDDSDGWYDHVNAGVLNSSNDTTLSYQPNQGDGPLCIAAHTAGVPMLGGFSDRCGPGMRQPLIVISPYAKVNHVDHTLTTQSSILQFIENNWSLGRIGGGSFDATAGSLNGMFNFARPVMQRLLMAPNGSIQTQVTVSQAGLPTFHIGHSGSVTRTVPGALQMQVSGGSLPAGLKFTQVSPSTFTISGKATGAFHRWFRVIFRGPGWAQLAYYTISSAR
ncbi:phospholipase C [Nocardioides baekrokdamisoli]|uniref:Phospholipase C n=1 Tax=Nocardioides baekrokdamisoli TaxID=1804624 RepID=A0A3G9J4P2_9ACTN|nr:alkaline phosphatase family protein [Nocardioides baekrokdamisoli]BBH18628.1 phospholipase C [Nocardioides baekrokdamisoli]